MNVKLGKEGRGDQGLHQLWFAMRVLSASEKKWLQEYKSLEWIIGPERGGVMVILHGEEEAIISFSSSLTSQATQIPSLALQTS